MTVALQLSPAAARQLRAALAARATGASRTPGGRRQARGRRGTSGGAESAVRRVLDLIAGASGTAVPLDPGIAESPLSTFFSIEVPDAAEAGRLAARLLEEPVVEAAYVKPLDEAPPA